MAEKIILASGSPYRKAMLVNAVAGRHILYLDPETCEIVREFK